MSKQVASTTNQRDYTLFSELPPMQKEEVLAGCRETTGAIYEGLDVSLEIRAVEAQRLGDTVLLFDGSKVIAFAVCHVGAKTEAGSGSCYVKFAAVRPAPSVHNNFERLLDSCEAFAARSGAGRLEAGVNAMRPTESWSGAASARTLWEWRCTRPMTPASIDPASFYWMIGDKA
jgi:hypothetical protein